MESPATSHSPGELGGHLGRLGNHGSGGGACLSTAYCCSVGWGGFGWFWGDLEAVWLVMVLRWVGFWGKVGIG